MLQTSILGPKDHALRSCHLRWFHRSAAPPPPLPSPRKLESMPYPMLEKKSLTSVCSWALLACQLRCGSWIAARSTSLARRWRPSSRYFLTILFPFLILVLKPLIFNVISDNAPKSGVPLSSPVPDIVLARASLHCIYISRLPPVTSTHLWRVPALLIPQLGALVCPFCIVLL